MIELVFFHSCFKAWPTHHSWGNTCSPIRGWGHHFIGIVTAFPPVRSSPIGIINSVCVPASRIALAAKASPICPTFFYIAIISIVILFYFILIFFVEGNTFTCKN